MKTDRLIGILSILLQDEKSTISKLAEVFEVSKRTINRDIDALNAAGIPIYTTRGSGGGVFIADGFRLDRTVLSKRDMLSILTGLRGLHSVGANRSYTQLMEKLNSGSSTSLDDTDSILVDLSSRNQSALAAVFERIRVAIESRLTLQFDYISPRGQSKREIEPYYLIFKWSDWYVYGFCRLRLDTRLFKLKRMARVTVGESFVRPSSIALPDLSETGVYPEVRKIKAIFDPSLRWQLFERFGEDSFTVQADGSLLFDHEAPDDETILAWFLSCGDKATLLEPDILRERLVDLASSIIDRYKR